jgi:hypothetical protein
MCSVTFTGVWVPYANANCEGRMYTYILYHFKKIIYIYTTIIIAINLLVRKKQNEQKGKRKTWPGLRRRRYRRHAALLE